MSLLEGERGETDVRMEGCGIFRAGGGVVFVGNGGLVFIRVWSERWDVIRGEGWGEWSMYGLYLR